MKVGDIAAIKDRWVGDCGSLPLTEAAANCRWLTGLCDGAHSRDGAGWSRHDRDSGTRLAHTPGAKWTNSDLDLGRRLSHKYRKQLSERPSLDALAAPAPAVPAPAAPPAAVEPEAVLECASAEYRGWQPDESQRAALELIRSSRVAILTGGPGTGKTTITRQVVVQALQGGQRVAAMAPTGIAASRLAESIDYPATTMHRALGAIPEGDGLRVVQPEARDTTAAADLVVVDEMSMVTSRLFAELLRTVKPTAQLLLIGDPDQLAPVGSGQPFTDLIDSARFPVARLTTVHRQVEGSRIREACDLVRQGQWYAAAPQASREADLVWLEEDSEERLADLCEELLVQARGTYAAAEVTLLTPRVTGGAGGTVVLRTEELNHRLQRRLNPAAGLIGGIAAGDPVVCTRNRPKDGVWNGTAATAQLQDGKLLMRIHDAEQRLVDCIEDCELAYAMSVHKYQGSQNRVIIVAAHSSGGRTLTRRLLYTAISRARERCILLGPRAAFEAAAQEMTRRRTLLRDLLVAQPMPTAPPPLAPAAAAQVNVETITQRMNARGGGLHPDEDPFARSVATAAGEDAIGPRSSPWYRNNQLHLATGQRRGNRCH